MNKQTIKWLFFLLGVLMAASLACGVLSDDDDDDDDFEETFCEDGLGFNHTFHWDEKVSPTICYFSGKVTNNGRAYAHNITFKVVFALTPSEISCPFHFDEIAPGATVEALCQFTADNCFYNTIISEDSCKFLDYSEHLDWLANKDTENTQDTESEEEPTGDDEMSIDDLSQLLVPVLDDVGREWPNKVKEHPCQPDQAETAYQTWVYEKAKALSDSTGQLVGDDYPWATLEAFRDWLIAESNKDEQGPITKTWDGDFDITNTALNRCQACTPPSMIGTISLTVDLKTCAVEGEISASGEGNVTVNDCINGQPIAATCTSQGTMIFSGDISGKTDETGALTLDQTTVSVDYASGWVEGCDWASHEIESEHWEEDPVTISGSINWQGAASGSFKFASTVCSLDGDWTIESQN